MRIDAHHHFWHYDSLEFSWIPEGSPLCRSYLPEEFRNELAAAGIDGTVVVQARQSLEETRWLLELGQQWPFIRGVVGWIDLCSPDAGRQLGELAGNRLLVGVRHVVHGEPEGFLRRADFRRGLSLLEGRSLTYDLLIFPRHLADADELAREFPRQSFVLDHLAKPWAGTDRAAWEKGLRALAANPNVCAKLSGLFGEEFPTAWSYEEIGRYLDLAFDAFGEDRLMSASNWPVCLTAGPYSWVMGLVEEHLSRLPSRARDKVYGGNAERIYGLA